MSELALSGLVPADVSTQTDAHSVTTTVHVAQTSFNTTLEDGTYVAVQVYASKANAAPAIGDLGDFEASYDITIAKSV